MERWLAHVSEDGTREQTILEHLEGTAELAEDFAGVFGAGEWGRLCGMAHDIGKYSAAFQRRLLENGPSVDHSTAGAVELNRLKAPLPPSAWRGTTAGCRTAAPALRWRMGRPSGAD